MKLKVGVLQFNPIARQIQKNLDLCSGLISKLPSIDILVLPEMCFTGYVFKNKSEILPYALDTSSLEWAKHHAKKLNCYLAYGAPQLANSKLYNSLYLVSPEGQLQFVHQKSHLYELDESWSEEGKGFFSTTIKIRGIDLVCSFAICMDLNPYRFKAPFEAYEFANAAKSNKSNIIICSNAWLHPDQDCPLNNKDMSTVNYWAHRLYPLFGSNAYCIIANRSGVEEHYKGKTKFAGSSCVLHLQDSPVLHAIAEKETTAIIAGCEINEIITYLFAFCLFHMNVTQFPYPRELPQVFIHFVSSTPLTYDASSTFDTNICSSNSCRYSC
eukprot:NODE_190_length_15503_cov_0.365814.p2 type:complete len:327 gc:universal NODE_190_length_15503_cov_0.365814:9658-8678(-)